VGDKPGMKDGRQTPVYRVLKPVILNMQRMYLPGAIVDLSHLPQESIRWFIENGYYETADGEPENEPAAKAAPCRNC